jgi:hypothetical protein
VIKWEYTYLFVGMRGADHIVAGIGGRAIDFQNDPRTPWDVLNAMGADGWEFVAAVPTSPVQAVRHGDDVVTEGYWIFYLKRPRLAG